MFYATWNKSVVLTLFSQQIKKAFMVSTTVRHIHFILYLKNEAMMEIMCSLSKERHRASKPRSLNSFLLQTFEWLMAPVHNSAAWRDGHSSSTLSPDSTSVRITTSSHSPASCFLFLWWMRGCYCVYGQVNQTINKLPFYFIFVLQKVSCLSGLEHSP